MAVLRINKTKNYTVMSNAHFKEKQMTLKAKGLLSLMLSLPDDWDYSIAGLVAICKENESAIKSTLTELKQFGYLSITKKMPNETKTGRIEYIYDIYEQPREKQEVEKQGLENQPLENLAVEVQPVENHGQLNTNKLTTKEQNTNEQKTKKERVDYNGIVNAYHARCVSLPTIRTLTDGRKKKLKTLLNKYTMDDLLEAFDKAEQSDFLKGNNDRSWNADFDWIINERNLIKILEGNYNRNTTSAKASKNEPAEDDYIYIDKHGKECETYKDEFGSLRVRFYNDEENTEDNIGVEYAHFYDITKVLRG